MIFTKEEAYNKIAELCERFDEQFASYKHSSYNETLTRKDFIDPFFKALGWDMNNSSGYAEAYREVIHEDKLKVGSATKAPDYSFRLGGGKRLFFVEAKKPSVAVKDDMLPAYQVRRYGWSAKMPISIITDFEEFSVYDCTKKPLPTDKASVARIRYITYKEYLSEFDFIWDTFSKERVLKGSFDKFVQSDTYKKGTATVDKAFLQSLDQWRTYLATSMSWRNKDLNEDEINFAVQQTLDRIIFLRIAEDRSVEPYGNLKNTIKSGDYYQNLFSQFRNADDKYNSGLFNFNRDRLSEKLLVDNKVIKNIITELYYPESPYEFSVLDVEIMGSAYEQFLGKQIKIDKAHRARIEEKPEVRKAGGVYYTPQYIVDYIVKNTVGKLIKFSPFEGGTGDVRTPEDISKLKIVDPACGSGSFLIGAYQYLLDWHKEYYNKLKDTPQPPSRGESTEITAEKNSNIKDNSQLRSNSPLEGGKGGVKKVTKYLKDKLTPDGNLTSAEKKRILLNNIYGVDIDVNAVEVTKLSLLLKCMEGETQASIQHQMSMFNERVLPSLENNIKCGNSLIDTDYYDSQLDFGEEKKIKPFNWQKAFPDVFSPLEGGKGGVNLEGGKGGVKGGQRNVKGGQERGGFDAVIGNPPYVRQELLSDQKDYYKQKYKVYHGMADLYSYFIEKSLNLLNAKGIYGVIVANKWMRANYGEPLRKFLKIQNIEEIIDFGDLPVFESATTYPCILIVNKNNKTNEIKITIPNTLKFSSLLEYVYEHQKIIKQDLLNDNGWNLGSETEQNLLEKINNNGIPLGRYVNKKIFRGLLTGLNEAFVINAEIRNKLTSQEELNHQIIRNLGLVIIIMNLKMLK
jgi:type I restriction-modification system DNA methylase subunit